MSTVTKPSIWNATSKRLNCLQQSFSTLFSRKSLQSLPACQGLSSWGSNLLGQGMHLVLAYMVLPMLQAHS